MKIYVAMKEWRQWHTFVMHQVKKSNALGLHVSMQQTREVIRVHRNVCQDNEIVSALSISVKKQACHLHEYFIWLNKFVNVPAFFILISVHWKESAWSSYIYIYIHCHTTKVFASFFVIAQVLVPIPLTIFRSNSKFDQKLQCSGLRCTQPITTKFCTCHDNVIVVTCAKFRCDQLSRF